MPHAARELLVAEEQDLGKDPEAGEVLLAKRGIGSSSLADADRGVSIAGFI